MNDVQKLSDEERARMYLLIDSIKDTSSDLMTFIENHRVNDMPGYPDGLPSFDEHIMNLMEWRDATIAAKSRKQLLHVGDRVMITANMPVMNGDIGELETGTVSEINIAPDGFEDFVTVKLDRHLEALEEWDNHICWTMSSFDEIESAGWQEEPHDGITVANAMVALRYVVKLGD